jgi:hypothetical protein
MTDDEDSEEPAVTLGTQRTVEGAPLARVSARLMWGIEKSAVESREGGTVIRTPDGPQELGEVLTDVDKQYFATRQEFEAALGEVIGDGAVPAEGDGVDDETDTGTDSDSEQTEAEDEGAEAEEGEDAEDEKSTDEETADEASESANDGEESDEGESEGDNETADESTTDSERVEDDESEAES